jgi:hypothetical protein
VTFQVFEVHGVLAGAYRGRVLDRLMPRTHVLEVVDGDPRRVLCGLPVESLCDVLEFGSPTCPKCKRKFFAIVQGEGA